MTDPMARIADALELIALAAYDVLELPERSATGDALRKRIEARHSIGAVFTDSPLVLSPQEAERYRAWKSAQQTPVVAKAGHPASAESTLRDRVAPSGGDSGHLSAPPDDAPEWRDVPAERDEFVTIRVGDRWWLGDRGPWEIKQTTGECSGASARWIKRHDHPAHKPAPQTVDVKAHELRAGDVMVAMVFETYTRACEPRTIENPDEWGSACLYRVRLPRPAAEPSASLAFRSGERVRLSSWADTDAVVVEYLTPSGFVDQHGTPWSASLGTWLRVPAAEPSAKAKCPTCRCMIAPGAQCACCESTSGDDPPLPSLDRDEEPSASGEGIARLRHTLLEIGAHSWAVGELHDQPWLLASRIVSAINAAHAHATHELRERCERAERDRDEARAAFNGVADERDRAKLERDAAVKRAEAAERVVTLARRIASGEFGAAPNAVRAFVDTLDAYDAARGAR